MKARAWALMLAGVLVATWTASGARKAAKGVHPILDVRYAALLGGVVDGKWTKDEHITKLIKGGERYRLYTMTKYLGQATGSKPRWDEQGRYRVVDVRPSPKVEGRVIAIGGQWQALPRVPKVESANQNVYRDLVRGILSKKGLEDAPVHLTQVIRIDLEGDGKQEVLIAACRLMPHLEPYPMAGQHSLVAVQKIVKGRPKAFTLAGQFYPNPPPVEKWKGPPPSVYEVAAVLDGNGDGVMEVFVAWDYHEGGGMDIYRVVGDTAKRVIAGWSGGL